MKNSTQVKKYNFSYGQQGQEEQRLQKFVESNLFNQTMLISDLIARMHAEQTPIFSEDEIHNYWSYDMDVEVEQYGDDEAGECLHIDTPDEVYTWYAFSGSEYEIELIRKTGWACIISYYGYWIGRREGRSAWDVYFLPALCDILYNTEE